MENKCTRRMLDKNKKEYTDILVGHEKINGMYPFQFLWVNLDKDHGLRLTPAGFKHCTETLHLEHWTFKVQSECLHRSQFYLQLEQISTPYYFNMTHLVVFSGEFASIIILCNDNIEKAINVYS